MKKRLLAALAAGIILALTFAAGVFAATNGVNIIINGKKIAPTGFVKDGQVMVPLEELANSLGGAFQWDNESQTATVSLPLNEAPRDNSKSSYVINVNKVTPGISTLAVSGEVTNTSGSKASFIVYGRLFDVCDQELTRTKMESLRPVELAPGETGTFEIYFLDYDKFKDLAKRYEVEVVKFSL